MTLAIYGDFTDPLSWIASLRVDALRISGEPVEWRAVTEPNATITTSSPLASEGMQRLEDVVHWWRRNRLPGDRPDDDLPHVKPFGLPPVSAYAEAVVAGVGDHVRHLLFSSFWMNHQDIGNPDLLRRLLAVPMIRGRSHIRVHAGQGYAVAIGGGPVTTDAWRLIRQWHTGFAGADGQELPVVTDGSLVLSGYAAVEHLSERVGDQRIPPAVPNPFELPPLSVSAQRRWADRPGLRPGWWELAGHP